MWVLGAPFVLSADLDKKKRAAKHRVAPDCEISDGTPIAGQQMNTAGSPVAGIFRLVRFEVR